MFKSKVRKFVGVVLCAVFVFTAIPLTSFAGEVDRKTAADPVAVLTQIEAMNLPEMPEELAAELRGGQWYVLYGYAARLASWCGAYCESVYNYIDSFLTTGDMLYASLPHGTPVYSGTSQSTPVYYKR